MYDLIDDARPMWEAYTSDGVNTAILEAEVIVVAEEAAARQGRKEEREREAREAENDVAGHNDGAKALAKKSSKKPAQKGAHKKLKAKEPKGKKDEAKK